MRKPLRLLFRTLYVARFRTFALYKPARNARRMQPSLRVPGGSCRDAGQHGANPGHPGKSGRVKDYINVVIYLPRTKLNLRTRK